MGLSDRNGRILKLGLGVEIKMQRHRTRHRLWGSLRAEALAVRQAYDTLKDNTDRVVFKSFSS